MRRFINKYAGMLLGFSLFLWIGFNLFIEDLSPQKHKSVIIPLLIATFLVVQGFLPKDKIKQIAKKIELKRIFTLVVLPPLLVAPMYVFIRFVSGIINGGMALGEVSGLSLSTFYHVLETSFLALGGSAFTAVFALYLMFPVLIAFSIVMLILEKKFNCHYRVLILVSPVVGLLLMMLMIYLMEGSFDKVLDYGNFYWAAIITSPVAVAIEQFFYKRKLGAGIG